MSLKNWIDYWLANLLREILNGRDFTNKKKMAKKTCLNLEQKKNYFKRTKLRIIF